ncbi:ATP-binding protein [Mycolicibacterium chitae]|uniref:Na+/H+ antiporter n=1 Tax=Mycolicibacterium chitae TaxID=1792 RepID=A0A3S4VJ77_MYCCI|nr:AAA family ATPase [Mycolicibacterium chitae]MCV7105420.1 AAA family ATPase [Mycolicibacterium chitae]BBZ05234.1 ATP-binding protein [Mycolicibacterium chitae]VEG48853.1 Na+/H+ antiporter [Mycolicibacterium chitae]
MLSTVAVHGYRSLRDIVLPLSRLTVLTGANGTGKSSVYRALRLLSDCGRGEIVAALAREGGLQSALWAGTGTKKRTVELKLGYAADDFGYLVDLGLPQMAGIDSKFHRDPEIKREVVFAGPVPRPNTTLVRRTGPLAQACADTGRGFDDLTRALPTYHSVLAEFAHPGQSPELAAVRDRLRGWRFYDGFRVDVGAPARRAGVGTRSPVLADDGHNLAAAVQTILEAGFEDLPAAVAEAFDGATVATSVSDGYFDVELHQPGVLRPLRSAELSDGTLRFLLWATALCSPQPPSLMVLNEPETSLHPDLARPLAGLVRAAAERTQVFVVTHSARLLEFLGADAAVLELVKESGQTLVAGQGLLDAPAWHWGSR